eukprot:gene9174-6601_t
MSLASKLSSPQEMKILKLMQVEAQMSTLARDVEKLMSISAQHGSKIKELVVGMANSVSQAEFMASITTQRYQSLNIAKQMQMAEAARAEAELQQQQQHQQPAAETRALHGHDHSADVDKLRVQISSLETELFNQSFRAEMEQRKLENEVKQARIETQELRNYIKGLEAKLEQFAESVQQQSGIETSVKFVDLAARKSSVLENRRRSAFLIDFDKPSNPSPEPKAPTIAEDAEADSDDGDEHNVFAAGAAGAATPDAPSHTTQQPAPAAAPAASTVEPAADDRRPTAAAAVDAAVASRGPSPAPGSGPLKGPGALRSPSTATVAAPRAERPPVVAAKAPPTKRVVRLPKDAAKGAAIQFTDESDDDAAPRGRAAVVAQRLAPEATATLLRDVFARLASMAPVRAEAARLADEAVAGAVEHFARQERLDAEERGETVAAADEATLRETLQRLDAEAAALRDESARAQEAARHQAEELALQRSTIEALQAAVDALQRRNDRNEAQRARGSGARKSSLLPARRASKLRDGDGDGGGGGSDAPLQPPRKATLATSDVVAAASAAAQALYPAADAAPRSSRQPPPKEQREPPVASSPRRAANALHALQPTAHAAQPQPQPQPSHASPPKEAADAPSVARRASVAAPRQPLRTSVLSLTPLESPAVLAAPPTAAAAAVAAPLGDAPLQLHSPTSDRFDAPLSPASPASPASLSLSVSLFEAPSCLEPLELDAPPATTAPTAAASLVAALNARLSVIDEHAALQTAQLNALKLQAAQQHDAVVLCQDAAQAQRAAAAKLHERVARVEQVDRDGYFRPLLQALETLQHTQDEQDTRAAALGDRVDALVGDWQQWRAAQAAHAPLAGPLASRPGARHGAEDGAAPRAHQSAVLSLAALFADAAAAQPAHGGGPSRGQTTRASLSLESDAGGDADDDADGDGAADAAPLPLRATSAQPATATAPAALAEQQRVEASDLRRQLRRFENVAADLAARHDALLQQHEALLETLRRGTALRSRTGRGNDSLADRVGSPPPAVAVAAPAAAEPPPQEPLRHASPTSALDAAEPFDGPWRARQQLFAVAEVSKSAHFQQLQREVASLRYALAQALDVVAARPFFVATNATGAFAERPLPGAAAQPAAPLSVAPDALPSLMNGRFLVRGREPFSDVSAPREQRAAQPAPPTLSRHQRLQQQQQLTRRPQPPTLRSPAAPLAAHSWLSGPTAAASLSTLSASQTSLGDAPRSIWYRDFEVRRRGPGDALDAAAFADDLPSSDASEASAPPQLSPRVQPAPLLAKPAATGGGAGPLRFHPEAPSRVKRLIERKAARPPPRRSARRRLSAAPGACSQPQPFLSAARPPPPHVPTLPAGAAARRRY